MFLKILKKIELDFSFLFRYHAYKIFLSKNHASGKIMIHFLYSKWSNRDKRELTKTMKYNKTCIIVDQIFQVPYINFLKI